MFVSIALTHFEVNIFLKKKKRKLVGPDYISPRILRECAHVLSSPLALFFNYILLSSSTTKYMEVGPHHSSP